MQGQGTSLVNTAYFTDLTRQINAIDLCGDLQALVNEAMASLQVEVTAIKGQITALLPLTTLPTDLGSIITWISHLAGPYIIAYENYIATLTQVLSAIEGLVAAIQAAEARIMSCVITIPIVA